MLTVLLIQLIVLPGASFLQNWSNVECPPLVKTTIYSVAYSVIYPITWFASWRREELCLHTVTNISTPIIPLERFSSFLHLKWVTAWVLVFIHNCRRKKQHRPASTLLSTVDLLSQRHWWDWSFEEWQVYIQLQLSVLSTSIHRCIWITGTPSWRLGTQCSTVIFHHSSNYTSRKTYNYVTPHFIRTSTTNAHWTHTSYGLTQSTILHHWMPENCSIHYSWLHYLSSHYSQAQTSTLWTATCWTLHPRLCIWPCWTWLCWTLHDKIWTYPETADLVRWRHCVEPLTPGHFLIGRPIGALPDPSTSYQSLLQRWHMYQNLTTHFWKRWSVSWVSWDHTQVYMWNSTIHHAIWRSET